jgi:hypothetical protein
MEFEAPALVWQAILDGKYGCSVARIDGRKGRLVVANEETKEVLLDKEVGLSYGALFGPDADDVTQWQEICCEVVDGKKEAGKEV